MVTFAQTFERFKEPYWRYQNKYENTESNVLKFANKKGNFDQNHLGLALHNSLASPYFSLKLQEASVAMCTRQPGV